MSPDPRFNESVPATEAAIDAILMGLAEKVQHGEPIDIEACCRDYPQHAAELRQVLPTLRALADFREVSPEKSGLLATVAPVDRNAPGTLGDFEILRELGRGGMGVVYEAEQISLKRRVALKVLPFAAVLDTRQLQRFRTEAMAAARLHHPHIVPVYQVGCDRAVHFYAMQYIDGRNVSELIRQTRRSAGIIEHGDAVLDVPATLRDPDRAVAPADAVQRGDTAELSNISTDYSADRLAYHRRIAELGVQAAQALDFAHQHGILHRDIKPSNLMLDGEGQLWVTDFGLARIEGDSGMTMSGDLLGTLRYMSPEQALGKRVVIDQRTDIYSLGVSLYEMLTLQPAYDGADRAELLRQISFEAPVPLRKRDPSIPADLETVVQTAMAREPHRRYETAQEFADDLQRFLDSKPILARRPSRTDRLQKWLIRNKPLAASLALVLLASLLVAYGTWLVNRNPATAPDVTKAPVTAAEAEEATTSPQPEAGNSSIIVKSDPAPPGESPAELPPAEPPEPPAIARAEGEFLPGLIPSPMPISGAGRWQLITLKPLAVVRSAVWSPAETQFAVADGNLVRIYDAVTHELLRVLLAHGAPVTWVDWHPDGTRLASSSEDRTVRLWTSDGAPTHVLKGHEGPVYQVAWRPDGTQLASASADGTVRIWTADGETVRTLDERGTEMSSNGSLSTRARQVFSIDWDREGARLATAGGDIRPAVKNDAGDNSVGIWDANTGTEIRRIKADPAYTGLCVDWRPDGLQLAVGFGHVYRSTSWIDNALPYAGVRIWNSDGRPEAAVGRDKGSVSAVAWNPDGQSILFGGRAGHVHRWDAQTREVTSMPARHSFDLNAIRWNAWGTKALTTSRQFVREDDPSAGIAAQLVEAHKIKLQTVKWSPDGSQIAVAGRFFFSANGEPISADGRILTPAKWWERHSHVERPDGSGAPALTMNTNVPVDTNWKFAWSKDGWLAGGNWWDHAVRIWDEKGELRSVLTGHRGGVESVAWSPDGTMLVSGGGDSVRMWQRDGTRTNPVITGHTDEVYPVEWSPDGRWIASGGSDSVVRLWRPNGTAGAVLAGHQGGLFGLAWSPDSQRIASVSWLDNTLRVWNLATGATEWQALFLGDDEPVIFDQTGRMATALTESNESSLLYVLEQDSGAMEMLTVQEFRERFSRQVDELL